MYLICWYVYVSVCECVCAFTPHLVFVTSKQCKVAQEQQVCVLMTCFRMSHSMVLNTTAVFTHSDARKTPSNIYMYRKCIRSHVMLVENTCNKTFVGFAVQPFKGLTSVY